MAEAELAFAKALVADNRLDRNDVAQIIEEKEADRSARRYSLCSRKLGRDESCRRAGESEGVVGANARTFLLSGVKYKIPN